MKLKITLKWSYFGVIYYLSLFRTYSGVYFGDTNTRMKMNIRALNKELVQDAIAKIHSVQFIKLYYMQSAQYQVGELMFAIRQKFKKMLELCVYSGQNIETWEETTHIERMIQIQSLAMDIDNLIEMIEDWERVKPASIHDELFQLDGEAMQKYTDAPIIRSGGHERIKAHMARKMAMWKKTRGNTDNDWKRDMVEKKKNGEDGFDSDIINYNS